MFIFKQGITAFVLYLATASIRTKGTIAFVTTVTKSIKNDVLSHGMQTSDSPTEQESSKDNKSTHRSKNDLNIQIVHPPDNHQEPELFSTEEEEITYIEILHSIENEVALKQFVKIINEQDRGIIPDAPFDFGSTVEQLVGKLLDTLEDVTLMGRRKMAESALLKNPISLDANVLSEWNNPNLSKKPRVLVIGSGWAAHAFIKCIDTDLFRVLVISPSNYFVFTPMLASSSVGTTEIRSIVESTRDSNPFVSFLEGKGLDIDTEGKTVKVALGEGDITEEYSSDGKEVIEIPYDVAVYSAGVGPISSSERTPGLSKESVFFLKSVSDARRLRSKVIDLLEAASQPYLTDKERKKLLTFVVVGGGPTGVEYCGELNDFLLDVTGREKASLVRKKVSPFVSLADYTNIKLLQGADELLPMFDETLRDSALAALQSAGVDVMTSTRVARIEGKEKIIITKENGKVEEIECGAIVWAAGTKPVKLTEILISCINNACKKKGFEKMPSSLSVGGRIAVDRWQRALGTPAGSVLAVGDASCNVGENTSPLPQTAQVAAQQGAYIARLLNRGYDLSGGLEYDLQDIDEFHGEKSLFLPPPVNHQAGQDYRMKFKLRGQITAKPFKFLNLGQLAYTGGGKALSQVQLGDKKLFNQAGSVGFLLWKSVYIVKQVSTKTRLLVLFDWFKTKLFGRDVTRM